jgi:Inner membrane component of T3SS, cytoplasmic domain
MRNSDSDPSNPTPGSRRGSDGTGAAPSPQVACLIGGAGPQAGRILALSRMVSVIGSDPGADVNIPDPSIDARHARIIRDDQGFIIEDLGSANGTFVDSQQIMRARLRDRGSIAFGAIDFTFLADINDLSMPTSTALVPRAQSQREQHRPPQLNAMPDNGATSAPRPAHAAEPDAAASFADLVRKIIVLLRFLRRYATLILLSVLAGLTVGAISVPLLPEAPTAMCEIKLDPSTKENPVDSHGSEQQRDIFFGTAAKTLTSPKLVEATLKKAGIVRPPESMSIVLASRITVEPIGANLFSVSYHETRQQDTPEGATGFLSLHIKNYVSSEIDKALHKLSAEVEFLRKRHADVTAELETIAKDESLFKEKHTRALPEQASGTVNSRFELESRKTLVSAEVRRINGELESARRLLAGDASLGTGRVQDTQRYRDNVGDLNRKITEGRAQGLADEHPTIRAFLEERRRIEQLISQQLTAPSTDFERQTNAEHQRLSQRIVTLEAQKAAAEGELHDTQRGIGSAISITTAMPAVARTLDDLEHRKKNTETLADELFSKLRKQELGLEIERVHATSRFEIIAEPQLLPLSIKKLLAKRIGLALAGMLAMCTAFIVIREAWLVSRRMANEAAAEEEYAD